MKNGKIRSADPTMYMQIPGVEESPSISQDMNSATDSRHPDGSAARPFLAELEDAADEAAVYQRKEAPARQGQRELEGMLAMIYENSQKIQQAAEALKFIDPEPCPVPSILGLNVSAAAVRLGQADLSVGRVLQEYHANVPVGHIIRQTPGPGGSLSKNGGVQIIVSKGPPPEKKLYGAGRQGTKDFGESGRDQFELSPSPKESGRAGNAYANLLAKTAP